MNNKPKTFDEFKQAISKEIKQYCFIDTGDIGTEYLCVLIIRNEKIEVVGELIYSCWSNGIADFDILREFGRQVEHYILGRRKTIPTLCWYEDKLGTL